MPCSTPVWPQDQNSRVACETYAKSNIVVVGGEITIPKLKKEQSLTSFHIDQIVRDAMREIGYVHDDDVFHADKIFIRTSSPTNQPDIAQGVDAKRGGRQRTRPNKARAIRD